jgi:hypothetical protein
MQGYQRVRYVYVVGGRGRQRLPSRGTHGRWVPEVGVVLPLAVCHAHPNPATNAGSSEHM